MEVNRKIEVSLNHKYCGENCPHITIRNDEPKCKLFYREELSYDVRISNKRKTIRDIVVDRCDLCKEIF
jgi:hypothetical protein